DYYRFIVPTNAVRGDFEIDNPSGLMQLSIRQGLPLPDATTTPSVSGTNTMLISLITNSTPVHLTPGEWFLTAINESGGPVTYSIKASAYLSTGQIIITNEFVTSNSFCLTWTSLPGIQYHVDGKAGLLDPSWTVLTNVTAVDYFTTWCL